MPFVEVAEALFSYGQKLLKADQSRRERLASTIEAMANCMTQIHTLFSNDAPRPAIKEKCAELRVYAEQAEPILVDMLGSDEGRTLSFEIRAALSSRQMAWVSQGRLRAESLNDIAETSGKLRGIAQMLRAGQTFTTNPRLKAWWRRLIGALASG